MRVVPVTSSGTGLGKTLVSAALTWQLREKGYRVRALKPLLTGYDPAERAACDAGILLAAMGLEADSEPAIDSVAPFRFAAPLSPDMAARREGRGVSARELAALVEAAARGPEDFLIVEGIGGVMVPVNERETVLDWLAALAAPPVLVVGSYLGTLSHTLTAHAALAARGLSPRGIAVSESPESPVPLEETAGALRAHVGGTAVRCIARLDGAHAWRRAPDLTGLVEP